MKVKSLLNIFDIQEGLVYDVVDSCLPYWAEVIDDSGEKFTLWNTTSLDSMAVGGDEFILLQEQGD